MLINLGILDPYCGLLLSQDARMVEIILEGLNQLLEVNFMIILYFTESSNQSILHRRLVMMVH